MYLSIVSTLFKSAPYLTAFYERCKETACSITEDFEIILVNDGSPDHSLQIVEDLASKDPRIVVIDLSRNFGHHAALRYGLTKAKGEWVFLIDSDLEESPEWLADFMKAKERDADVVYGVQERRKGKWFERISGSLYYSISGAISEYPIPKNVVTARLMSKEYVKAVLQYPEKDIELWVLFAYVGFQQQAVKVRKGDKGISAYSLGKKVSMLFSSITSSSNAPLYGLFFTSIIMWGVSFLFFAYYFFSKNDPAFLLSFFGLGISTVCVFIGIGAVYLAKILKEVKNRPFAIEKSRNENRG
jgi:putative glycosyltransferase